MKYKKLIIPILLLISTTIVNATGEIESYKSSKTLTSKPDFVNSLSEKSKNNDEVVLLFSTGSMD